MHEIETKIYHKLREKKRSYLNNLEIEDYNLQKTNKEIILSLENQPKKCNLGLRKLNLKFKA